MLLLLQALTLVLCLLECLAAAPKAFQDRTSTTPQCDSQYSKVGCFRETKNNRQMPVLLFSELSKLNRLNQSQDDIDFRNWTSTLQSLACRCAKETIRRGNEYFSLQSLGECWTTRAKQQTPDYRKMPMSDSCVGVDFESCDDDSDTECIGQRLTNYIYKIPDPNKPDPIDQLLLESLANYSANALDQALTIINNQTGRSHCEQKIDLVFVVDGSGSVEESGRGNFNKSLEFVKRVSKAYSVSDHNTHVGIIVYGTKPTIILPLDKQNTLNDVIAAADSAYYPSSGSNTGRALKLAKQEMFQKTSRPGVPRMLLLMTDGKSYDDVIEPAIELKALGVTVFSLGVGKTPNDDQLSQIASEPVSTHLMKADYDELKTLGETMATIRQECETQGPPVSPEVQERGQRRSQPLFLNSLISTFTAKATGRQKLNGVIRKVWKNIDQDGLPMLKTDNRYPWLPDEAEMIATFDSPVNVSDYYGQQMSAYFVPPASGNYTFMTSCNSACELWLSRDSNPFRMKKIVTQKHPTSHNSFDRFPVEQHSAPVHLKEDHCYYLQALMTSSQGGDNLSVGVTYPSGRVEAPLDNVSVFIQCPAGTKKTQERRKTKKTNTQSPKKRAKHQRKMLYRILGLLPAQGKVEDKEIYISNCFDGLPMEQCSHWAELGLCENPSMYGPPVVMVRTKCQRTCGICKRVVVAF